MTVLFKPFFLLVILVLAGNEKWNDCFVQALFLAGDSSA